MLRDDLVEALRCAVLLGSFNEFLVLHGEGLDSFELFGVADVAALIEWLAPAEKFSEARYAVVADLLRLYQRCLAGDVLSVLVYVLHSRLVLAGRGRFRGASGDESASDLYEAVAFCAGSSDLGRSDDVEKRLVNRIAGRLRGALCAEQRHRKMRKTVSVVAESAVVALSRRDHTLADLLERTPRRSKPPPEVVDINEGQGVLRDLVEQKVLDERDAVFLERRYLQKLPLAVVASGLDLEVENAAKIQYRARKSLKAYRLTIRAQEDDQAEDPEEEA